MKRIISLTAIFAAIAALMCPDLEAQRLSIIHTNDTHSQIDPTSDGMGGIKRRKEMIDSIRNAEPNTLLIDLGDAVQGTLYFNLYNGEVEMKAMNELGYDLAILGNHDFDNGMEMLARNLALNDATWLSTNYDTSGSLIEGRILPYAIKEIDGKRVAFIALNLNPEGMISTRNYTGIDYLDIIEAANATAWAMKNIEHADVVVALTHIGYKQANVTDDLDLAAASKDIDVIIGGHSHTVVNPADPDSPVSRVKNSEGREIVIAQTGNSGRWLGQVDIDLATGEASSKLMPVIASQLTRSYPEIDEMLAPYKTKVDSLLSIRVARSAVELDKQRQANLYADLMCKIGKEMIKRPVSLALINNGGIRQDLPKGVISEGEIMMALPFTNRITIIEISGADLLPTFNKMLDRDINGVSDNVDIKLDDNGKVTAVTIDGEPLDPNRTYTLATIDYLANGGDYLSWLKNGKQIAQSPNLLYTDIKNALLQQRGRLNPPAEPRVHH